VKVLSTKLRSTEDGLLLFRCPGCNDFHSVHIAPDAHYWNGSADRPTFSPSIMVTTGHFMPGHKQGAGCWCTYNAAHPREPTSFKCQRCHSFVFNGEIRFESDSTHALAGQTVELPDWRLEDV
jgi:hypothetical protein